MFLILFLYEKLESSKNIFPVKMGCFLETSFMCLLKNEKEKQKMKTHLNVHYLIGGCNFRDDICQFRHISLEDVAAKIPQDLGREFVARYFSLLPPLVSINGENSIA